MLIEHDPESSALRAERATVEGLREVLANYKRLLADETREKNQALRELHDARVRLRQARAIHGDAVCATGAPDACTVGGP